MPSKVIIGAQWGDEGKGKIVDFLAENADLVVRFQGGHNAGHTLVIDGTTYKLSLLPSGIIRGKQCIIGNGVVLNPWALLEEINKLRTQSIKITSQNLLVSDQACLILPPHWRVDQARERAKGAGLIGTTGRGIGPAYEDKVARRAIRVCDLFDTELLTTKVASLTEHHNLYLQALGAEPVESRALLQDLQTLTPELAPYIGSSWRMLCEAKNKNILFEGAQGTMLDIDFGTYPFVSSSNTVSPQAFTGSGSGVPESKHVLGVAKAYVTRVGSGPFPTRDTSEAGELLRQRGNEFGTVTGRKRDCGWFDAVAMRYAIQVASIQSLAITKIDVLDTFETIPVCVGYTLNGEHMAHLPPGQRDQAALKPVYENLPGWQCSTRGLQNWNKLPSLAQSYIKRLEELTGVPISIISTGPEREQTILR